MLQLCTHIYNNHITIMLDINNLREERVTWPGGFGVFSVS